MTLKGSYWAGDDLVDVFSVQEVGCCRLQEGSRLSPGTVVHKYEVSICFIILLFPFLL